jgi:predicted RNA polymerase sigma factor
MTMGCLVPRLSFPVCNIALSFVLEDKADGALLFLDEIIALGRVEDLHTLVWLKGFIQERKGEKDEAFVSYLQSQLMAKTDVDKNFMASQLYDITSQIVEDPENSQESEEDSPKHDA